MNPASKQLAAPTEPEQQAHGLDLNPGGQKGPDPRRNPGGQMGQGRPADDEKGSGSEPHAPQTGEGRVE